MSSAFTWSMSLFACASPDGSIAARVVPPGVPGSPLALRFAISLHKVAISDLAVHGVQASPVERRWYECRCCTDGCSAARVGLEGRITGL
jgi:hypothetical protein